MVKIKFISWQIGARPIPFIKLLHRKAGLSLIESKKIKDKIINEGKCTEIIIKNKELAMKIAIDSKKYGINCELIEY
jgi:hypothetical protein